MTLGIFQEAIQIRGSSIFNTSMSHILFPYTTLHRRVRLLKIAFARNNANTQVLKLVEYCGVEIFSSQDIYCSQAKGQFHFSLTLMYGVKFYGFQINEGIHKES